MLSSLDVEEGLTIEGQEETTIVEEKGNLTLHCKSSSHIFDNIKVRIYIACCHLIPFFPCHSDQYKHILVKNQQHFS